MHIWFYFVNNFLLEFQVIFPSSFHFWVPDEKYNDIILFSVGMNWFFFLKFLRPFSETWNFQISLRCIKCRFHFLVFFKKSVHSFVLAPTLKDLILFFSKTIVLFYNSSLHPIFHLLNFGLYIIFLSIFLFTCLFILSQCSIIDIFSSN